MRRHTGQTEDTGGIYAGKWCPVAAPQAPLRAHTSLLSRQSESPPSLYTPAVALTRNMMHLVALILAAFAVARSTSTRALRPSSGEID